MFHINKRITYMYNDSRTNGDSRTNAFSPGKIGIGYLIFGSSTDEYHCWDCRPVLIMYRQKKIKIDEYIHNDFSKGGKKTALFAVDVNICASNQTLQYFGAKISWYSTI